MNTILGLIMVGHGFYISYTGTNHIWNEAGSADVTASDDGWVFWVLVCGEIACGVLLIVLDHNP